MTRSALWGKSLLVRWRAEVSSASTLYDCSMSFIESEAIQQTVLFVFHKSNFSLQRVRFQSSIIFSIIKCRNCLFQSTYPHSPT
jgi:hypothetical protein